MKNTVFGLSYGFHISTLASAIALCIVSSQAYADDWFNPAALQNVNGPNDKLDLSAFSQAGNQTPGNYHVDVYLNGEFIYADEIKFFSSEKKLFPSLNVEKLKKLSVNIAAFPALAKMSPEDKIGKFIPDASTKFDFARQRLDVSIPQAALLKHARGYTDPKTGTRA